MAIGEDTDSGADEERQRLDGEQYQKQAEQDDGDDAENYADDEHGGDLRDTDLMVAPPPPPRRKAQDT